MSIWIERLNLGGKTKLGDWLYGSLTNIVNHYQIVACTGAYMDVQEETIGQFTGLYDKNKVPIYERGYS